MAEKEKREPVALDPTEAQAAILARQIRSAMARREQLAMRIEGLDEFIEDKRKKLEELAQPEGDPSSSSGSTEFRPTDEPDTLEAV
jgi:hypothetical protein